MRYQPHNYQTLAQHFIEEHPVCAVFLEMGLGKTVITLSAVMNLLFDSFSVRKVLVVAPLRVARDTWMTEATKWNHLAGLKLAVAVGTPDKRRQALTSGADVVVINRENLHWLITQSGVSWVWDMVVIDELSSFKNRQAQRFKALMKARPKITRIVGLTGTPASNGLMDLWAEFRLLDNGERLGRYITRFRERWFVPDARCATQIFSYKPRPGAEQEIYQAIADITLSMKTVDHLHLPKRTDVTHEIELDKQERKAYNQLRDELILELKGGVVDAKNAAVLVGKLLQMASGAVYTDTGDAIHIHDKKLDLLEDLIEAANGKPVLVAYWFAHDRERIHSRFPNARDLTTSADIQAWNKGEIPLALIHPASAGHGLNLQAGGSTLIWFSLTWSLELYQQANARLHRQGQSEPVTIHHLVVKDSVDTQVMQALKTKNTTQAALIDAVKTQLERK